MFSWKEFDVSHLVNEAQRQEIIDFSFNNHKTRTLRPRSITSREEDRDLHIPVKTTGGRMIRKELSWLFSLYENEFKVLAQRCSTEEIYTANDDRYAVNINLQKGMEMRYECHVDSNPIEGLLYLTNHPSGSGGELVVSMETNAKGTAQIRSNSKVLYPKSKTLVFFDARDCPHYVEPLAQDDQIRVVVAMNYYTPSCPESARPQDLNFHLFGED